jgi:hypothetical protein
MSKNYSNKTPKADDLIFSKFIRQTPIKRTNDQQDNESLNTMDYYKGDASITNQPLVEEDEVTPNQSVQIKRDINKTMNESCSLILDQTYNSGKSSKTNRNKNLKKSNLSLYQTDAKNVQKRLENSKKCNDYCCRCKAEIGVSTKACPYCLNPFCLNCLKQIFNRNLDNNDDLDNFDQDVVNEKVCPNCRNLLSINNFVILKNKKKSSPSLTQNLNEPMDSFLGSINNLNTPRKNNENSVIIKELTDESNEYDTLMKKISQKKKEIETKKTIGIYNLQTMIKAIEYEFKLSMNKLDEMFEKLKKIKESIDQRKIKMEQQQRSDSNSISQEKKIIGKCKNIINNFYQNYDKLNQKIILKSKEKAYKIHESNPLTINIAETYCMKYKNVIENNNIGSVYFKIERFVNSYVNYLDFSVLIKQNEKENDSKDNKIKSKYIVNLEINDQLIKLNKSNKDENKSCLNYENIMQENKALVSKNLCNSDVKNKELNIKVIISELFL